MAFTYGFYNSLGGDRKYNAKQISEIFDGVIIDGILLTIGDHFEVTVLEGMTVIVGSGRAWFNHTWSDNDSPLPFTTKASDPILSRYDALVLEVDTRDESRINSVKWVYGVPASNPEKPVLIHTEYVNQYPLSYILTTPGLTELTAANLENAIGLETPIAKNPLEHISSDFMIKQWQAEWESALSKLIEQQVKQQTDWKAQTDKQQTDWNRQKADWEAWFAKLGVDIQIYATFDFDNLASLKGVKRHTSPPDLNPISEIITIAGNDTLVATRINTANPDGSTTIVEKVYKDGSTIIRETPMVVRFNEDGSITEEVGI